MFFAAPLHLLPNAYVKGKLDSVADVGWLRGLQPFETESKRVFERILEDGHHPEQIREVWNCGYAVAIPTDPFLGLM